MTKNDKKVRLDLEIKEFFCNLLLCVYAKAAADKGRKNDFVPPLLFRRPSPPLAVLLLKNPLSA